MLFQQQHDLIGKVKVYDLFSYKLRGLHLCDSLTAILHFHLLPNDNIVKLCILADVKPSYMHTVCVGLMVLADSMLRDISVLC